MRTFFIIGTACVLAACGGPDRDEEERAKGGVIGETYVESLEEAEAVEDLVNERADRIAEEIEKSESPD